MFPAARRARPFRGLLPLAVALRSLLALGMVWYGVALWIHNTILLPSPLRMIDAFAGLLASGDLVTNAAVSIERLLVSLAVAIVLAVPLGFLMGLSRVVEAYRRQPVAA